jgi:tetratricopeptide (TPR) repeat protein
MLAPAYRDLRRAIIQGKVSEAETIGELIIGLMTTEGGGSEEVLQQAESHREAMLALLEGIESVQSGDNLSGIEVLRRATEYELNEQSLVWGAWLWISWSAKGAGDLETARQAAATASELAVQLDDRARSTCLCTLGEIEALEGDSRDALKHLALARDLYERVQDHHGMATSLLIKARVLADTRREGASIAAAREARDLDPGWVEPVLFLVQLALKEGDVDHAEEVIDSLPNPPAELERERQLLHIVRRGEVPLWVVNEYMRLRQALPSRAVVGELEAMMMYSPQFMNLREELAWKLLKLGQYEEATGHFNMLAKRELDPYLRSSVLVGLGCLASVTRRHREVGVRVKAAVDAVPESMKKPIHTTTESTIVPAAPAPRPKRESRSMDTQREVESITEQKAVFSGDLQMLAIPALLDFLRNTRRTGTLVVSTDNGMGAIYLRKGSIIGASSPNSSNIGQLLLEQGHLTTEALEQATQLQEQTPERQLGAVITEAGMAPAEAIREGLVEQVYRSVREMYGWQEGSFAFSPDTKGYVLPSQVEIQLDPQHVLMDVLGDMDQDTDQDTDQDMDQDLDLEV